MNELLQTISNIGIVPVIAIDDAKKAVPLAHALVRGGLPIAEVTFRTDAAYESIKVISEEVPEILLGAGTVLSKEQLDLALDAGARFILSPGFNPEIVKHGLSKGVLMIPGTATGGEMEQAMSLGLEAVKFFPAELNGGLAMLKALSGPYNSLKWVPTGGINACNLADYLSFDRVLACGGTWMVKKELINGECWDEITALCKKSVDSMLNISFDHTEICGISESSIPEFAKGKVTYFNASDTDKQHRLVFSTPNVDRAIFHLQQRGVSFNPASCKKNQAGQTTEITLLYELNDMAIHLVKR